MTICLGLTVGCAHQPHSLNRPTRTDSHVIEPLDDIHLPAAPLLSPSMDPIALGLFRWLQDAARIGDPEGIGVTIEVAVPGAKEGDYTQWPSDWFGTATVHAVSIRHYLDCVTRAGSLEYSVESNKVIIILKHN